MGFTVRTWLLFCLLGLLLPGLALAGKFRQAAYITNIYFSNRIEQANGFVQPETIFNRLKAGDQKAGAYLVLNLVVDKGEHRVDVDILDQEGTRFDRLAFEPILAAQDDATYTAAGQFGGVLPAGGIFFKVYDSHDSGEKEVIGTFRLMTAQW